MPISTPSGTLSSTAGPAASAITGVALAMPYAVVSGPDQRVAVFEVSPREAPSEWTWVTGYCADVGDVGAIAVEWQSGTVVVAGDGMQVFRVTVTEPERAST